MDHVMVDGQTLTDDASDVKPTAVLNLLSVNGTLGDLRLSPAAVEVTDCLGQINIVKLIHRL